MSIYPVAILVGALLAGLLGFSGIAGDSAGFAKILFLIFALSFVTLLLVGKRRGF